MDPHVLPILRCPRCRTAGAFTSPRGLVCSQCGLTAAAKRGYYDLLDIAHSGEPAANSGEQRLMESEVVARAYERLWRPTFVRLLAGRGAGAAIGGFAGEMFIHKHALALDEHAGPWLDLSCGPGLFTRAMAASAPGALIIGLDISRAMLELAASRAKSYGNVVLVRGDAHQLPFIDGAFQGINNSGALHAYDDAEQVLREVARTLRPGGVYVGSTFAEAPSLIGRLAARVAGIRRYDPGEMRAQLSRLGFSEYEELRLGGAFVFKARKP